jgi:hypothetical protein
MPRQKIVHKIRIVKKTVIGILILSLINLSCSAGKVLTAEEQDGYDIINHHYLDVYNKTLSNKLDKYNSYESIDKLIKSFENWEYLTTLSFKNISLKDLLSGKELESLVKKAEGLKRVKLNRNFLRNTVSLYSEGRIVRINFPLISDDGKYGFVYQETFGGTSIRVFKKEEDGWKIFAYAGLAIYDYDISAYKKVPEKYKPGKLVQN